MTICLQSKSRHAAILHFAFSLAQLRLLWSIIFCMNPCMNPFLDEVSAVVEFGKRLLHDFIISRFVECRFGMRGRLWLLWSTMTFGGLFTCLMGVAGNSFAATQAFIILAAAGIEVGTLQVTCCDMHAAITLMHASCKHASCSATTMKYCKLASILP